MATQPEIGPTLQGEIKADGSSTVYLITEAAATNFKILHPAVRLTVGISGTGGGFKKFAAGETDLQDASRKIKPAEAQKCQEAGIGFTELQVAWDGLAVVISKENTWAQQMTMAQLKKIWHPESAAKKWSDVDPSWPSEPIKLYGAGPDSGTFDYFTEAVNGKEKVTRTDYTPTEDDNITVQGVARNKFALGYFGVAFYEANKASLGVVHLAAKQGDPHYEPSVGNVLTRKYPISRPLYIYLRNQSLRRPEMAAFAEFYLRRSDLVSTVGYVPLSARAQFHEQKKLAGLLASLQ